MSTSEQRVQDSCKGCAHFDVCGKKEVMKKLGEEIRPISTGMKYAEDFHVEIICKHDTRLDANNRSKNGSK